MDNSYQYENKPRGFFRFLLAVWRLMKDQENIKEAAIVELTFNRSRWGKKVARWDLLAAETANRYPSVAAAIASRSRLERVQLDELLKLPPGSFGNEFAQTQTKRGVDPNLIDPLPVETDGDWLMAHVYETHDFWHFSTGFNFDMEGEYGVAGVYMAQMPRFTFLAFMLAILLLKSVWKDRDELGKTIPAFCRGYDLGKKAQPLVGVDWPALWPLPIEEVRKQLDIEISEAVEPQAQPVQELAREVA